MHTDPRRSYPPSHRCQSRVLPCFKSACSIPRCVAQYLACTARLAHHTVCTQLAQAVADAIAKDDAQSLNPSVDGMVVKVPIPKYDAVRVLAPSLRSLTWHGGGGWLLAGRRKKRRPPWRRLQGSMPRKYARMQAGWRCGCCSCRHTCSRARRKRPFATLAKQLSTN